MADPHTAEAFVGKKGGREKRWCRRIGCVKVLAERKKATEASFPRLWSPRFRTCMGCVRWAVLRSLFASNQKRKAVEQV